MEKKSFFKDIIAFIGILVVIAVFIFTMRRGLVLNNYYNTYKNDVVPVNSEIVHITEDEDSEGDTYYYYTVKYMYEDEEYTVSLDGTYKKHKIGDTITISIFPGRPDSVFNEGNGRTGKALILASAIIFILFFSVFSIKDCLPGKKKIDSERILNDTRSGYVFSMAEFFTAFTVVRLLQLKLFPELFEKNIAVDISLAGVVALIYVILFVRMIGYSVSEYRLENDVCIKKYADTSGETPTYTTTFKRGKQSQKFKVYNNTHEGKECYLLLNSKDKIISAYDIQEWGTPGFSDNDFDYRRAFGKCIVISAVKSLAVGLMLMALYAAMCYFCL